jgi:DegV family protein with EDD domain
MRIKISVDSTCDLPRESLERHNIGVAPLYIVRDGESLRDGAEITADDLYAHVRATGRLCSTAAVSFGDYMDLFGAYLAEYDAVIHFTIAAGMSSCWQNACMAARKLGERVYVVDSENLSAGIGLLALCAAERAESGADAAVIAAEMEALKKRLDVSFVIETLDFLRRGGRCSAVAALGANLLRLRPCIEVKDAAMEVGKKYRGAPDKYIPAYIAERLAAGAYDRGRCILMHSGVDAAVEEAAAAQLAESGLFDEVLRCRVGCTISNHCGPGALGLVMLRE